MREDEFWSTMRELRSVLASAGEVAWSNRLLGALSGLARRTEVSPELIACLSDLRVSETAARLGLRERLTVLLAQLA